MKKRIESILRQCTFVQWDRFVDCPDKILVYGWMDRKDEYKDFIVVTFWKNGSPTGYIQSSVKNAAKIRKILGIKKSQSIPCMRVEHHFRVKNSIKLPPQSHEE